MTEPEAKDDRPAKEQLAGVGRGTSLNYQEIYLCPVCRHGHISAIALMDAFACNFCRHIFSADLANQFVRVEDSSQPMSWRWNGRNWQSTHSMDIEVTAVIWLIAVALMILPAGLIGFSAYAFPPLDDSEWRWFPFVWVSLTFVLHSIMVGWLLLEHYQFSPLLAWRIRLQEMVRQR
jgi:hypothetical protein